VDLAVGTDLVEIAQVASAMRTFGRRYLERVFTPIEIDYCLSAGADAPSHFAARFAAKEAALKAIRVGDDPIDWRSIEVQRQNDGSCRLALRGAAHHLAHRRGIDELALSMSHEGRYASAVVVGRRRPTRRLARISRTIPRGAYER
jgi:holo-[acyl-carrier protein] synthase